MDNPLPAKCAKLYAALESGAEKHVINLYCEVVGKETDDQRFAQQVLGSYIARLNRRIKAQKQRVEPGSRKGTYVLAPLS